MKRVMLAFLSMPLLFSFSAWAQEAATQVIVPVAEKMTEVANPLLQSLNGQQGVTSMAVIAVLVQALMLLINSRFGSLAGKYRLSIMYALNAICGITALKLQGVDTFTALTHSNTMAAYQVMANQAYKQFFKKES